MANTKRYWSGLDELHETEAFKTIQEHEFPETKSVDEFLSDDRIESTSAKLTVSAKREQSRGQGRERHDDKD